jgi:uncharacterized protein
MPNLFFNPEEGRVRSAWRLLIQLILAIVFSIALNAVVSLTGYSSLTLTVVVTAVGFCGSIYVSARYLDGRRFDEFGLKRNETWKLELWEGLGLGCAAMLGIWIFGLLIGIYSFDGFGWERAAIQPWLVSIGSYFVMMVAVGFYEELWVRGYQMRVLAEGLFSKWISARLAVLISVVVSSLIFGLLHANNPNASWVSTVNVSIAGVMLALPYVMTGRLWMSIGLHFSWNFAQGAVFGFPVSGTVSRSSILQTTQIGPSWLTGAEFGPEAGVMGLGAMVVLTLWIVWRRGRVSMDPMVESFVEAPGARFGEDNRSFRILK